MKSPITHRPRSSNIFQEDSCQDQAISGHKAFETENMLDSRLDLLRAGAGFTNHYNLRISPALQTRAPDCQASALSGRLPHPQAGR